MRPRSLEAVDYDRQQYLEEKKNGDRLPNGAKPLKRLTEKHRKILRLHLAGIPNQLIAESLGASEVTISRILHDPLGVKEIAKYGKDKELEFEALYGKTVDALRDALDAKTLANTPAHTTRLKAVDIFYKASGKYKDAEDSAESAEDVIQRILRNPLVQINVNSDPQKVEKSHRVFDGELDGSSDTDE
jgi:hypothetical protein